MTFACYYFSYIVHWPGISLALLCLSSQKKIGIVWCQRLDRKGKALFSLLHCIAWVIQFYFPFSYLLLNSLGLIATFFLSCLIILLIKWIKYIFLFRGSSPSKSHWKNRWKEWVVLLCSTDFICYSKIFKGFNGGNTSAKYFLKLQKITFTLKFWNLSQKKIRNFILKQTYFSPQKFQDPIHLDKSHSWPRFSNSVNIC